MTARQAALAGLGNAENRLISLDEVDLGRRKAPQKTEEELAEKRREAAKRRKMQLEQKTKEEKEGAVDRLLNKQAPRPRAKRNMSGMGTAATGTPTGYSTPVRGVARVQDLGDGGTRSTTPEEDESNSGEGSIVAVPPATTIRWVSTSRGLGRPLIEEIPTESPSSEPAPESDAMEIDAAESPKKTTGDGIPETAAEALKAVAKSNPGQGASLAFALSIPAHVLSQLLPGTIIGDQGQLVSPLPATATNAASETHSAVPIRVPAHCAVEGCDAIKKYRVLLSGGIEKGACGLDHFRVLKGQVAN